MNHHPTSPRVLLRRDALLARVGGGRSWLYDQMARGLFPRPIKIGRMSVGDSDDVDRWIAERVAANQPGG